MAIFTWRSAADPTVYGWTDLDVERALAYIDAQSKSSKTRITLTHFVGRAVAEVYRRHPTLNVILRRGGIYPRKNVDIYFTVANDAAGMDLAGAVVRRGDQLTLPEFAQALAEPVESIRTGKKHPFQVLKKIIRWIPSALTRPALSIASLVLYGWNLYLPVFGLGKDAFGSVMISNIGSLGLDSAFPPLVPVTRVPMLVSICRIKENAVVRDGKVVVAKQIRLGFTIDHRVIDGVPLGPMAKTLEAIFANPEVEFSKIASSP